MTFRPAGRLLRVVCPTLLLFALAGCSAAVDAEPRATPSEDLGPISRGLQQVFGSQDSEQQALDQTRVEEAIASCMKEQGFAYQPVPYAASGPSELGADVPAWGTQEFAVEYGYGITTAVELGASLVPGELPDDPNQDYVDAMSDSERQSYWASLYGELATSLTDPEGGEIDWDWTTAGCSGVAQHEVYDRTSSDSSSLVAELSSLYEDAPTDPRYLTAEQAWAACMADAGYHYDAADEPRTAISDDFSQALDPTTGIADATVLADLRERELATASSDARCRTSSTLDETLAQVTAEAEEAFYTLHRDEVDAWFAEQAPSGS